MRRWIKSPNTAWGENMKKALNIPEGQRGYLIVDEAKRGAVVGAIVPAFMAWTDKQLAEHANLFAAAPEMFAALEALEAENELQEGGVADLIRAALKKARGIQ